MTENLNINHQPERVEMPADLLTKSPAELDAWLTQMSQKAAQKGSEQVASTKNLADSLPAENPHKAKLEKLAIDAKNATEQLAKDLSKIGLKVEQPASAWTPEKIEALRAKNAARQKTVSKETPTPAKPEIAKDNNLSEARNRIRLDFSTQGYELGKKLGIVTPETLGGSGGGKIENEIKNFEKTLEDALKKVGLDEKQIITNMMAILSDPNLTKIKKALTSYYEFEIQRAEDNIKRNKTAKKNPSTVRLRGTGSTMTTQQDINIAKAKDEIANYSKKLQALDELDQQLGIKTQAA